MRVSLIIHILIFLSLLGGASVLWWRTRNKGALIMLAAQCIVLVLGVGGTVFSIFHFAERPTPYGFGQAMYAGWIGSSLLFCAGFLWYTSTIGAEQASDGNAEKPPGVERKS